MRTKIAAVMTCYNRKEKTLSAICKISKNEDIDVTYVVVDDKSTDGTLDALNRMKSQYDIIIKEGTGSSFYTGGMRIGLDYLLKSEVSYDYILLCNDDVDFFENSISKMVSEQKRKSGVIVGVCCDHEGRIQYSAVRYSKGFRVNYFRVPIGDSESADTFCANCVLIPWKAFIQVGNMDVHYSHSFGDFDYGFALKRAGYNIFTSEEYVGECIWNSTRNTWADKNLTVKERIMKKETVKGLPRKEWFYYLKKNFGLVKAYVFSITPYIRILLRR